MTGILFQTFKMADVRATKSGLALEAQQKIRGKYDEELASQLLQVVLLSECLIKLPRINNRQLFNCFPLFILYFSGFKG